jgi:hypothetical protein
LPVSVYPAYVAERRLEFHAALDAAISQWQNIELWLSQLFAQVLRSDEPNLAQIAFDSITGFREKLRVLDAVLRSALQPDDEYLKRWETLKKKLDRLASKRSRIAHGLTMMMPTDKGIQFFSTPPISKYRDEPVNKATRDKNFRSTPN